MNIKEKPTSINKRQGSRKTNDVAAVAVATAVAQNSDWKLVKSDDNRQKMRGKNLREKCEVKTRE